ncbi:hypothetical protein Zmor_020327 [Zophobas morio]|uniref:Uncharacterized protein n=1 Tax=Zophobas morio TaxID=2755281 RepID=A0AA38M9Z2_9CUCU|nr:hypothetical protein Zmor_020327 [Zophobas morio]
MLANPKFPQKHTQYFFRLLLHIEFVFAARNDHYQHVKRRRPETLSLLSISSRTEGRKARGGTRPVCQRVSVCDMLPWIRQVQTRRSIQVAAPSWPACSPEIAAREAHPQQDCC